MTNARQTAETMHWGSMYGCRKWLRKMSNFVLDPYVVGPRAWGYL